MVSNIILGNRYELLEKIAEGGMSTIYKAYCKVLNRVVAVKILKSEFSENEEFLTKFNNEARACASLNHPNIINVYDVGKDDDIAYIVMEYVDGINLKQLIKKEGRLDEKTALNIVRQTCLALNEAHKNGIIHRDIKPHNIMINKNGIVKVGDFGIARAASSTTMTMGGDVIGSVHYFSPEQARGGYADERSDLYSLGIVLYELVIGEPPFDADTPIAVALKHINENVTIPEEFQGILSRPLQNLILKLTQKNIKKRYPTAISVIEDIDKILGEKGNYINLPEDESDDMDHTKVLGKIDVPEEKNRAAQDDEYDYSPRTGKPKSAYPKRQRTNQTGKITIFAVVIIIIAVAGITLKNLGLFNAVAGDKKTVPDLLGEDEDAARDKLRDAGLEIQVSSREETGEYPEGKVIKQYPSAGSKMAGGEAVTVVISAGGEQSIKLDDFTGLKFEDVKARLEEKGIVVTSSEEADEKIEKGLIISQKPEKDTLLKEGDSVAFVISKGQENPEINVPSLIGQKLDVAQKNLQNAGFTMGSLDTREDNSSEENTVLEQNPVANTKVRKGTMINLTVSKKTRVITKTIRIVLPKREKVTVTLMEKSTGQTVYNSEISTLNGMESIDVQLSGTSGQVKQLDIYLDGDYYATTAPINF